MKIELHITIDDTPAPRPRLHWVGNLLYDGNDFVYPHPDLFHQTEDITLRHYIDTIAMQPDGYVARILRRFGRPIPL